MKKTFLLIAAAVLSMAAMAETTINPTWEGNYRSNANEPTGWTTVTTTAEQFEVYNGARFFAVQTWVIPNINELLEVQFVYTRVSGQSNAGDISMWAFPYNSMVTSTENYGTVGVAFLNDVKTVLGVYPGNTIDASHQPLATSVEGKNASQAYARIITLDAAKIATLKAAGNVDEDGNLKVNVLLTTLNSTNNYKYYSIASSTNPHSYATAKYASVINNTTKAIYTSLEPAVTAATAGDTLVLKDDVTISAGRLNIEKTLTIKGATGEEKIICGVAAKTIMLLNKNDKLKDTLSLMNLVVDAQGTVRSTQIIENGHSNQTLILDNISVINSVYADNVVCGDVKNGGGDIVLKGNNSFSNGIYLNRDKRIDNLSATHTADNPVTIYLASDYQEDYAIVLNCEDATLYKAIDAKNEYDWTLTVAQSGDKNELKGTKTKKAGTAFEQVEEAEKVVKVVENGQVFILRNGVRYNILGAQF